MNYLIFIFAVEIVNNFTTSYSITKAQQRHFSPAKIFDPQFCIFESYFVQDTSQEFFPDAPSFLG